MNHYRYRSTTSERFSTYDDAPDPTQPPGAGWELCGQSSASEGLLSRMVWSWRQVAFVTPGEFTDQFQTEERAQKGDAR